MGHLCFQYLVLKYNLQPLDMDFLIVKHQTNIPFYFQTNLFNVVNFMSTLYKYEVSKLSAIGKCQALTLQPVAIECDD